MDCRGRNDRSLEYRSSSAAEAAVVYYFIIRTECSPRAPSPDCAHLRPSSFFDIACTYYILLCSLSLSKHGIIIHSTKSLSVSAPLSPRSPSRQLTLVPGLSVVTPLRPYPAPLPPSSVVNKIGLRNQFDVTTPLFPSTANGRPTSRRDSSKERATTPTTPTASVMYIVIYRHAYM